MYFPQERFLMMKISIEKLPSSACCGNNVTPAPPGSGSPYLTPSLVRAHPSRALSESVSCSVVSDSLRPRGLQPTRLLCPWDSPGKNTGVGCHSLLQGILQTQGSNQGLLHFRQILSEPPGKSRAITREPPFSCLSINHSRSEMLNFTRPPGE